MANRTRFAGLFNALDYAYGCPTKDAPPPLIVDIGNSTAGAAGTLTLAFGQVMLSDGTIIFPLNTNAPVNVGVGANLEKLTPSAVGNPTIRNYDGTSVTFTSLANVHGTGDPLSSATFGLQEALNDASAMGGGQVIIDARWAQAVGTVAAQAAIILAATIPVNVSIYDNRTGGGVGVIAFPVTLAAAQTLFSKPIQVLPAPGSAAAWEIIDMVIEAVYGSAAFTAGGAIQLSYGAGVTTPATATIAATFLTTFSASQMVKVAGVIAASTASTAVVNAAVNLTCATQDFAGGTAGSLQVRIAYRLLSGL